MGVKYLWDIIDDARSVETLDSLRGKTICVDLSIWIVEAKQTLQFKTSILKPHLRNLFFRVLYLRRLGVKLIFVTEGDPPDLKQETMRRRAVAQYGVKTKIKGKIGRGRFQHTINECTKMLDLIGVPHVRGHGEAEAMCAVLNKHKMADGCLTNDGDFFLYGGETIYRDFGINPKDQHVLIYTTEGIKKRTNLTRHDMIGLALLNGCDYTQGVAGVGKRTIKKFLEEREFDEDLLIRIQKWSDEDFKHLEECSDAELTIIKKLHKEKANKFPDDKIIDEFLVQKDKLDGVRQKMKWSYPHIKDLQEYLLKHLEWPEDYTLPKILQLATSTYLEKLSDGTFFPVPITPTSILKTRCQMGVALVDVGWDKHDDENTTYGQKWTNCPDTMVTLENQQVVTKTLPKLIEEYDQKKSAKTTKKKGKELGEFNVDSEDQDFAMTAKNERLPNFDEFDSDITVNMASRSKFVTFDKDASQGNCMSKNMFDGQGTAGWMKKKGWCSNSNWMLYTNAKQPMRRTSSGQNQIYIGSFMMFREID
ncbi:flap endonuclease GEN homolog 1-like isoform X2 [Clytia hemisphaerica]|uniref:flap endonuclease GEN homolog 1-like isoform X2 n=1 Tax=Clytia hemisphaerica TaxID=252671 RepID=UPI0034D719CA